MKIEQLIVQHLYNNKKVTLQDIGSFILSSNVLMPMESTKDGVMPENAISFEYNTKANEDESLISFIVEQTRKIKPLATSDLESYTILGREYLNIGKPFPIEGLGTLHKTQTGQYEFIQGHIVNPKLQAAPALLKEKDDEAIVFTSAGKKTENNNNSIWLLVIAIIAIIALAAYFFLNKNKNEDVAQAAPVSMIPVVSVSERDSNAGMLSTLVAADSTTYKVVIKNYATKELAEKALARFTSFGHHLYLSPQDSTYNLVMPFTSNIGDSTRVKDSLNLLFGSKTYLQNIK